MQDLKCRTARIWLQAPDELGPLDARFLERHLDACADCSAYRRQQVGLDRELREALGAAIGAISVREHVRARLQGTPVPLPKRPRGYALRWRRLIPALALAPMSAAAIVIAVFLSPAFSHRGVTPIAAAFHAVRSTIGFPLSVDPTHPNHLLAGAWGQVYESWNAGDTWRPLGTLPPLIVRDVAIDASNPRRYLVAAKNSVLISEDAGKHWRVAASGLLGAENMFLIQHPLHPDTFFVGPSVLWKSADHGATWSPAGTGQIFAPNGIQSLTVAPNGDLFTAIWGGGVAVSHNGGLTWQRRAAGLAPHAMNVVVGAGRQLWAATDRGIYLSEDSGRHWRRQSPPGHVFTTSVLDQGGYLLAGGNGGVYRSTDGGRHWEIATSGLPLDPYIFGFVSDPRNPLRVYASLNSDGIFRSDDGGLHWQAVDAGLPIAGNDTAPPLVLFQRQGALWSTDSVGADPGNRTIDNQVRIASVAPDGAGIAYITGSSSQWLARVVAAGGSAARTLTGDTGSLPRRVLWAPNSSLIALVQPSTVTVVDLSSHQSRWTIPRGERFLDWTPDARNLLFWQRSTGTVAVRSWQSGALIAIRPHIYPGAPISAPNGRSIAVAAGGHLLAGTWRHGVHPVARLASSCRLRAWSAGSTRILVRCGSGVQERGADGRLLARARLPANTFWVPGSRTDLLFFRHGALWRWSGPGHIRKLVTQANSVYPRS